MRPLFLSSFVLTLFGNAQTKAMLKAWKDAPKAYAMYDSEGIPSSWDAMVDRLHRMCALGNCMMTPPCIGFNWIWCQP